MTIIPDKHTFTIWKGASFYEVLTLFETMDKTQPRDLTNYSAELIIRKKPNDDTPSNIYLTLATLNNPTPSDNGCSIDLPTGSNNLGRIILKIDPDVTKNISWKSAVYDLTITDSQNRTDALLYGGIKVNGV
jgi:hypothetical protein